MHEANFTQEIVETILTDLKSYPAFHAKEIKVKVGEMLHLVPESVQAHYHQMTQGTSLEGVSLVLEEMPVIVKCRVCGVTGGVEDHHWLACSECGAADVELIQGDEVSIGEIEIEK